MPDYKTISDNELIDLLKESDHAAYTEIYNRYFYLIFTHAYKKLRDQEQAKDIVQDIFATLWFKRKDNLPMSNLAGYLYTATRNRIFDLFAHQQVQLKHIDSLREYLNTHTSVPTDHRIRENELLFYIEKQIQALPQKMRKVFELSKKDHLSNREIALHLNVTESNVSQHVNNAMRILRTKLTNIFSILF